MTIIINKRRTMEEISIPEQKCILQNEGNGRAVWAGVRREGETKKRRTWGSWQVMLTPNKSELHLASVLKG